MFSVYYLFQFRNYRALQLIFPTRIYYTGENEFSTTTQFGTDGHDLVASPNGTYTVTPTAATTLSAGTNYFWLTYDIPSGAVKGDFAEAAITSVVVSGSTKTPASTTAATQLINAAYCTPAATNCAVGATSYGYISNVQLGTINNSSASSNCGVNSSGVLGLCQLSGGNNLIFTLHD